MAGMGGMMIGGSISSGGRQLIRFVTMGAIYGGIGVAGLGMYGQTLPPQAQPALAFVQANWPLMVAIGVGAIALGAMLSFWSRHRMMKQMSAGMPGMGGGMGDMSAMMAGMQGLQREVVKVRCGECDAVNDEAAAFCASCGKPMRKARAAAN